MLSEKVRNYRRQNGCHNCGLCFVKGDYDSPDTYFCNVDQSKRPLCGSVWMREVFWDCDLDDDASEEENDKLIREADAKADKMHDDWDGWSEGREVAAWGICDKWVKADEPSSS